MISRLLLLGLSLALVVPAGAGPRDPVPQVEAFWSPTLEQALERARAERRWVLVFFEAPFAERLPTLRTDLQLVQALESLAVGATINSESVEQARKDYGIERVPALVLLDPDGRALRTWERRMDRGEVYRILVERRDLRDRQVARLEAAATRGAEALERDDLPDLARELQSVEGLRYSLAPRGELLGKLRRELVERLDRQLLQTLALEGIEGDHRVIRRLKQLEKQTSFEPFNRRVRRQIERMEARKIVG